MIVQLMPPLPLVPLRVLSSWGHGILLGKWGWQVWASPEIPCRSFARFARGKPSLILHKSVFITLVDIGDQTDEPVGGYAAAPIGVAWRFLSFVLRSSVSCNMKSQATFRSTYADSSDILPIHLNHAMYPTMIRPKQLTMGVDCPSPSMVEEETRVAVLQATVEHYLPEFAKAVEKLKPGKDGDGNVLILHQDAFAAGYDDGEYTLLGMAIKYAGLKGVNLQIIGENHSTF